MSLLGLALIVALLIPIFGLLLDSPLARALGTRLERGGGSTLPDEADLARRLDLVEGDVELLRHTVDELREENQFLQRLLEDRRALPPDGA